MTPDRFRQVRDLFEAALDHALETRGAFLDDACAGDAALREEIQQLLAADAAEDGAIDIPAIAHRMGAPPSQSAGSRMGAYEILREIGKGGMGIVYLSRRADGVYPKLVALKVLRSDYASADLLHRFEQERRILASLEHPNIARLFDGGRTPEGLPFYVMEYIDGQPIDEYCDLHHLDVKGRLALFQQVCAAVESAHRSGVVHRDIKPSNILVTAEGLVKLLDFGIAKQLHTGAGGTTLWLTDAGLRPMTPEYASPEQIQEAEVTRATDVYSLGVVLYEMLTGHRPYRLKNRLFHEILRVVCEEDPTLPSAAIDLRPDGPGISPKTDPDTNARLRQVTVNDLRKQLSGDLDSILLKALRKDAWQRYNSAGQLSDDIGRHLEGSPVQARSGRYYRLRKRLSQNRGWLVLALFLLAALATGGIHVTWPAFQIATGAVIIFGIWHIGADRQLARRIAGGPIWPALNVIVIAAFFISVIGLDFMDGLYNNPHERDFNSDPLWPLKLFWCVPLGLLFARWVVRSRWGGSLVLDASSGRNKVFGALAIVSTGYIPAKLWWLASTGMLPRNPAAGLFFEIVDALLWVFLYALSGRLEFRQYGIVTASSFYRWPNIESYSWSEDLTWPSVSRERPLGITQTVADSPKGCQVLNLKLRRRHPILPAAVEIKVAQAKRPEIEAVMARFLSEWPGALSVSSGVESDAVNPQIGHGR